jgi:hypothetical protein
VFRGDPDTYHFSGDGITWTSTESPQASRSHLIDGNTIYTRYNVLVEPAHVYALFGKTLFEDKEDLRNTYGSFHLQRFEGGFWSDPVLVSESGTQDNWYPNMNEDLRHGIGILYMKGGNETRKPVDGKIPLDIMFASTGAPR